MGPFFDGMPSAWGGAARLSFNQGPIGLPALPDVFERPAPVADAALKRGGGVEKKAKFSFDKMRRAL